MNEEAQQAISFAPHISVANIPRFGVDLQYETLKNYLDNISGTINQHAQLIDSIEKDMNAKLDLKQLSDVLINVSEGCNIHENELLRTLQQQFGRNFRSENIGNQLEVAESKLFNKEVLFSYAISFLFQKIQGFQMKFDEIDEGLQSKVGKSVWKEKKKKHKRLHQGHVRDLKDQLEGRVRELDGRVIESIAYLEDKVIDTEKKTLWRINDCEEVMKSKITEIYVNESLRGLEDRLKREFGGLARDAQSYEIQFEDIRQNIRNLDVSLSDKIKQNKKGLADLELNSNKTFLQIFRYETEFGVQDGKINDLTLALKEIDKKTDFSTIINRQNQRLRSVEDKLNDMENDLLQRINELALRGGGGSGPAIDPHTLCQIQNDLNRIQGEYNKTKNLLRDLQTEIQNKLDLVDQTLLQSAEIKALTKKDDNAEFNFEEVKTKLLNSIQPKIDQIYVDFFAVIDEEKVRRINRDIQDIKRGFEAVGDSDKKLQKLLKELDINHLIRMIQTKADDKDIQMELLRHDQTLVELRDSFAKLQKDLAEQLRNQAYSQTQVVQTKQQPTIEEQMILTSKRLYPLSGQCISCNKQPQPQNSFMKQAASNHGYALGSDGRPYKVDMQNVFNQVNVVGSDLFIGVDEISRQQSAPNIKKLQRPSTAKLIKETKNIKIRPDSAKEKLF